MATTLTILTSVPAVTAVAIVAQARRCVAGTSLRLAWGWSLAAVLAVVATWLADAVFGLARSPWNEMAWYGTAELLLCPLIAVLGARRPGVTVWNWFVLLPLLAVLGWPVAAAAGFGAAPGSFVLDTPPLLGMLLVLVMGCGNYLGTRFQASALALAAAVLLLILPLASGLAWPLGAPQSQLVAVWCVGAAAVLGRIVARRTGTADAGPDRVWQDFRSQFGVVWAHRIQERINERAIQEAWPVRLERHGFVPVDPSAVAGTPAASERIEHALRWLLRRFVDDAWIDVRLRQAPNAATRQP